MRRTLVHVLAAILLAIFAIVEPASVRADCEACSDCTVAKVGERAPCSHGQPVCQTGQGCVSLAQKLPMQAGIPVARTLSGGAFGDVTAAAIKSSHIQPETAPPRA